MKESSLEKIVKAFSLLNKVEAIALSGSKTSPINDEASDSDIYIYSDKIIDREDRRNIFSSISDEFIIASSLFEEGDEAIIDGLCYDFMYRTFSWMEEQVKDVWIDHNARLGYTTCFIYNLKSSKILFDRNNRLRGLQRKVEGSYSEELRSNIIKKNFYFLDGPFAFPLLKQLEVAIKRGDKISIQHRLSAILQSYFDILFAYNRVLHPGEKKLVKYAHLYCTTLPSSFDEDIEAVLSLKGDDLYSAVVKLISSLKELPDNRILSN